MLSKFDSSSSQHIIRCVSQPQPVSAAATVDNQSVKYSLVMVALCNRADHYIFILFLSSSSSSSSSFFFFFFFPRLISPVGNWMFTILCHMVWP